MGRWLGLVSGLIFLGVAVAAPMRTVKIPEGDLAPFWIAPQDKGGKLESVHVLPFEAATYPVTNAEFQKFVATHPEWGKAKIKRVFADKNYLDQFNGQGRLKPGVRKDAPATFVSWFAARAYCESGGMRLPTLVEWEYMAAASETKADASRDSEFLNRILEWYSQPRVEKGLSKVGARKPNLYGVHDLHGLIWEWVEDFNSGLVTGEGRTDGSLNRDLFCGAGSMSGGNKENYAAFMRFAFRSSLNGSSTTWNLGFRCVKGESK